MSAGSPTEGAGMTAGGASKAARSTGPVVAPLLCVHCLQYGIERYCLEDLAMSDSGARRM